MWSGTLEDVMDGLTERIVGRSDDPDSWEYATWLNLTPKGQQASGDVIRKNPTAVQNTEPPATDTLGATRKPQEHNRDD